MKSEEKYHEYWLKMIQLSVYAKAYLSEYEER